MSLKDEPLALSHIIADEHLTLVLSVMLTNIVLS